MISPYKTRRQHYTGVKGSEKSVLNKSEYLRIFKNKVPGHRQFNKTPAFYFLYILYTTYKVFIKKNTLFYQIMFWKQFMADT